MVNISDFVKRLEEIFSFYGLSASSFAQKINVQRSNISHVLSGRNKPSLEFVLKVIQTFPEVNLYWLLHGEGSFPHTSIDIADNIIPSTPILKKTLHKENKTIDKIIIFYKDGSFEAHYDKSNV